MYSGLWVGNVDITYDSPPMRVGSYVYANGIDGVQIYRMCFATVVIDYGEVVREAAVIISAVGGAVTTTQSLAGTNSLHDTAAFTDAESLLIGAFGKTLGVRGNGGGQAFYVTSKVGDDELKVFVYAGEVTNNEHARIEDGNWGITLALGESYDLWKTGRVRLGVAGFPPVGVCQVKGTAEPMVAASQYFFAKVSGLAECIGDATESPILEGQMVVCQAAGLIGGIDTTLVPLITTPSDVSGYLGIAMHSDISEDTLVSVSLDIPIRHSSQHLIRTGHPLNIDI